LFFFIKEEAINGTAKGKLRDWFIKDITDFGYF
jgi:hypothetical protein